MTSARFLRRPAELVIELLTVGHVEGQRHLPTAGPCILVANHLSFFDAVVIYALAGGDNLTGWAAEKWENNLIFGTFLRLGNAVFIQRGQVDRHALEHAADWLRAGKIFGMTPEGTRSLDGALGRARPGVAYLASLVDCPIVPIAHWGTEATWSNWMRLRRPRIEVRIGAPFRLPALSPDDRSGSLRRNADEVMCHLAALMPLERRGLYAGHPRLEALLADAAA